MPTRVAPASPAIVDVTDFGVAPDQDGVLPYLVMEFLDGCTLAHVLRREPTRKKAAMLAIA